MTIRKLALVAGVALMVTTQAGAAWNNGSFSNGLRVNGIQTNGWNQGRSLNGWTNGRNPNGWMNGQAVQGRSLNGQGASGREPTDVAARPSRDCDTSPESCVQRRIRHQEPSSEAVSVRLPDGASYAIR